METQPDKCNKTKGKGYSILVKLQNRTFFSPPQHSLFEEAILNSIIKPFLKVHTCRNHNFNGRGFIFALAFNMKKAPWMVAQILKLGYGGGERIAVWDVTMFVFN